MHRTRALALFTAVNIDGKLAQRPERESDRWILDPRLPAGEQTGEAVYRDNPLDRGHLVRRLDPAWGTEARREGGERRHVPLHQLHARSTTTSTPGSTLWAGLEDYVLDNADNANLAVSVFTGPVLADDDDRYRGVQLPRQFWKVVAMVKRSGELSVTGYLLSQAALLDDLEADREFSYGAYRTFQVPVAADREADRARPRPAHRGRPARAARVDAAAARADPARGPDPLVDRRHRLRRSRRSPTRSSEFLPERPGSSARTSPATRSAAPSGWSSRAATPSPP